MAETVSELFPHKEDSPGHVLPISPRPDVGVWGGGLTLREVGNILTTCADSHAIAVANWIWSRGEYRASRYDWPDDAQAGRFQRGYDGAQYQHPETSRSFATGGISSEFDRRLAMISAQSKFDLLISGIGTKRGVSI